MIRLRDLNGLGDVTGELDKVVYDLYEHVPAELRNLGEHNLADNVKEELDKVGESIRVLSALYNQRRREIQAAEGRNE